MQQLIAHPETRDLDYQEDVIREMSEHFQTNSDPGHRALLAVDTGLGKTYCMLEWLRRHPEAFPALIICPAGVKYNWEREALRFIGIRPFICEGRNPPDMTGYFDASERLTVINYDILPRWTSYLMSRNFRTMCCDESQKLQNLDTYWTKATKLISVGIPNRFAMSATPILNNPFELFPTVNILWPHEFPNAWGYSEQYCGPILKPWGWDHSGAKNLDHLHAKITRLGLIRKQKRICLPELPGVFFRSVLLELGDEDEYRKATTDFMGWLKTKMSHRVHAASKAEKLTQIGYVLRLIARLKLRPIVNWANQFLQYSGEEKLILFMIHQAALEVLQRRLEFPLVAISQNVVGRKRQALIDQFQNDPKIRVCLSSAAGGVGVNLTAASEIGIGEFPWRPGDIEQWIGRADRLGQTKPVYCNFLITKGTYEEDLCRLLQKKKRNLTAVMDGGQAADGQENIYQELIDLIEGKLR